jgi:hypothetical protein
MVRNLARRVRQRAFWGYSAPQIAIGPRFGRHDPERSLRGAGAQRRLSGLRDPGRLDDPAGRRETRLAPGVAVDAPSAAPGRPADLNRPGPGPAQGAPRPVRALALLSGPRGYPLPGLASFPGDQSRRNISSDGQGARRCAAYLRPAQGDALVWERDSPFDLPSRRHAARPLGGRPYRSLADPHQFAPASCDPCRSGQRMWIERGFKRTKRGGWPWQATRMSDPARADCLWVVIAVATRWLVSVGGEAEAPAKAPDSAFAPLEAAVLAQTRQRRATRLRTVAMFRQGRIRLVLALLDHEPLPFG